MKGEDMHTMVTRASSQERHGVNSETAKCLLSRGQKKPMAFASCVPWTLGIRQPRNLFRGDSLWVFLLLLPCLLFGPLRPALGWGDDGHKLIAEVAYSGLTVQAKENVDFLLRGTTLDKAAVWPDAMRTWQRNPAKPEPVPLVGDPQATLFFQDSRNARQPNWHFVDLPNGSADYAMAPVGTGPDDIVHALRRCIAVLRGHPLPGEYLNPPQALRLLLHYVGDIHQPLHAASGYWTQNALGQYHLVTGAAATTAASDRGGNNLHYGPGKFDKLHGHWDFDLVDKTVTGGVDDFAGHLTRLQAAARALGHVPYKATGDPLAWPVRWANESASEAARAYLLFLPPVSGSVTTDPTTGEKIFTGNITLPTDYDAQFKPVADRRLALAAFRLAAVLNATLSNRDLTGGNQIVSVRRHPRKRPVVEDK
jgi:hypothetical protein